MVHPRPERPLEDSHAQLEKAFIAEYLGKRGYDAERLHELPEAEAQKLLRDASIYASGRLTELESRAHLIGDLHSHGGAELGTPAGRRSRSG